MIDYPLETVVEGKTSILVPNVEAFKKSPTSFPPSDAPVFYNKVMELNRDFALATLRVFMRLYERKNDLLYCEPMAGSGIRSVRAANEIENIIVIMNDLNPHAVKLIQENVKKLKLKKKSEVFEDDANALLLRFRSQGMKFDVIDIDPFGSPATFIDSAAQAIANNGLLAVTSTDMATKCGVYPNACIRKYASKPIHSSIAHELSVRMLIGYIATALARHEKNCKPIFAHSTAHYIRVYVIANKGITEAKKSMKELGFIAHCPHCFTVESEKGVINQLSRICPTCQEKRMIGGPFWLGKIFDEVFIDELTTELDKQDGPYHTLKKMKKLVSLTKLEVEANKSPQAMICYYDLHQIADKLNLESPKLDTTIEVLQKQGFIATRTHFRVNSIKTDAPVDKIIEAMKQVLKR